MKFPGTSDMAQNEMKVIPAMSGIIISIRLIRKRIISIESEPRPGLLPKLNPFRTVQSPCSQVEILKRVAIGDVFDWQHGFNQRQLIMQDLLNLPIIRRALMRI